MRRDRPIAWYRRLERTAGPRLAPVAAAARGRVAKSRPAAADPAPMSSTVPLVEARRSRREECSPSFVDPTADRALRDEGYAVVDLLDADAVAGLRAVAERFHLQPSSTWESDFYDPDRTCRETVAAAIASAFAGPVATLLTDHETYLHSFVLNWPGDDGGLRLHGHSSTVAEGDAPSLAIWCAVTDATEENGTLHVVPGSHHLQAVPKAERGPAWFDPHVDLLLRDHLSAVPLRAGQAIVFDNDLLHGSFANTTEQPRIAAVAPLARVGAQLLYHDHVEPGRIRRHRLHPGFFLERDPERVGEWAEPNDLPVHDEIDVPLLEFRPEDLAGLLPRGSCRHDTGPA